jgi:zinc protease
VKGKEAVEGHDAYVVEATPAEGTAETMYFDVDSGVLVRTQAQGEFQGSPITIESTLGDYREVDGVKIPFVMHQSMGDFGFTIRLTEVKHNVPLDDAKFDKPTQ